MSTLVQKSAPDFKATAVVNGQFKEINLSAHRGEHIGIPRDLFFCLITLHIVFPFQ